MKDIILYFDFDMTLGYRIMMWRDTVRELLLEEGVIIHSDEIRSFSDGKGYPWSFPLMTHEEFFAGKDWWLNTEEFIYEGLLTHTDSERAMRVSKKFRSRYINLFYWRLFPDTVSTLELLNSKGYTMNILSNHVPEAKNIIEKLGISRYFDKIFISADMGVEKPNPIIYQMALSHTTKDALKIMIGDSYEADIIGALNNGFDNAIMVRKPNTNKYMHYTRFFDGIDAIIEEIINENR